MSTDEATLRTFYDGWGNYQRLLVDAIRPLTEEQLGLRPAPHQWTLWQLVSHIVGARVYWFHKFLREGDPAFAKMFTVDHTTVPGLPLDLALWEDNEDQPRSAPELAEALEKTWELVAGCVARWDAGDLLVQFTRQRRSGAVQTFARGWVIWHVIEHDLHHGGEISNVLGSNGLPALDI